LADRNHRVPSLERFTFGSIECWNEYCGEWVIFDKCALATSCCCETMGVEPATTTPIMIFLNDGRQQLDTFLD